MLNKIISYLIIIGVFVGGYFFYNYKYLPEKQQKINAQVKRQQEVKKQEIEAKKEIKLTKQVLDKSELTSEQKIQQLKEDKKNYKTFNLKNGSKVYFKEAYKKLDLYSDNVKIGNFDLVYPEFLIVEVIEGSLNDLYIEVGKHKFFYNSKSGNIVEIDLKIEISYLKKADEKSLIIVTKKGSFTYYINDKKLEYFSYFNDYVVFKDGYIGLVRKDEKRVLNNLGFETETDLIVYYNPNTKDKKILNKLELDTQKIYVLKSSLFLVDIQGEIYELENIASNL